MAPWEGRGYGATRKARAAYPFQTNFKVQLNCAYHNTHIVFTSQLALVVLGAMFDMRNQK